MGRWFLSSCVLLCGCGFEVSPVAQDGRLPTDMRDPDMPDRPLPACMTNPAYTGASQGHGYRVIDSPQTDYDTAVENCALDGAHLASINSGPENNFVADLINGGYTWIGFDDLFVEDSYRWVNGAPDGFRAFNSGEPNDSESGEDCTVLNGSGGGWNDSGCEELHRAVCECDPGYVAPAVNACRAVPLTSLTRVFKGRKYLVQTAASSWQAAVATCAALEAHLAVPADDHEAVAIDLMFLSGSWIGYSDLAAEGAYQWITQAPTGYDRWAQNEPSGGMNDDDCVAINAPMSSWDDTACSIARQFVCECEPIDQ